VIVLPRIIANRSRSLEDTTSTALKFGPGYSFTVPGLRIIDVSKPEWIEYLQKSTPPHSIQILATFMIHIPSCLGMGPLLQPVMLDVLGHGIFVADGPAWKRARQATVSIFTHKTFKVNDTKSTPISFSKDLGICDAGYLSHSGLSTALPQLTDPTTEFPKAFDLAQNQMDFRLTATPGWQLLEWLNIGSMGKRMKESCQILDEFVYSLIDQRLADLSRKPDLHDKESSHPDLLSLFITTRDERGGGLGRAELRDTALNLIIAGRDTTAQALSWAFFHLVMNKELICKIRDETIEVLGDDPVDDQLSVSYENYKQFVWTHAVVLEALRLHPSVPKNAKIALSDDKIPGGPTIEAGDMVRWSDWQMARDPSIWGDDCGDFKPQRWIDDTGSIKQFGQFKFHAFNGGPRLCPGMNLAILEAVKVIVQVLREFELEFAEGWLENVPKGEFIEGVTSQYRTPMYSASLTLPMDNPMMISVRLRELD
ncbi:hypothetical protein PSHT_06788, partial [Puccinia striiformis]